MVKILVAEDNTFISKIYKVKLSENNDWELFFAKDGDEAVNKIIEEKPDVILLDLMLPQKDGFQVLKEIKSNSEVKNIPVIITSGLGQQSDMDKVFKLGAADYFVKSEVSMDEIVEKIKNHLTK